MTHFEDKESNGGPFLLLFLINDLFVKLLAHCLLELLSLISFVKNLSFNFFFFFLWDYDMIH